MTARPTLSHAPRVRLLALAAVLVAVGFAIPDNARADTLYAVTGQSQNLSTLYTVNPTTGALTQVGPIEINGTQQSSVNGLAVDPLSGQLYGFMNQDDFGPNFQEGTLLEIDKTTGDADPVGSIGDADLRASDMAFDARGNLYAWEGGCGANQDCDHNGSDLYEVDTTTGTTTKVGESGTEGFSTGIAFDSAGSMYLKTFRVLLRVNPFTGHVFEPQGLSDNGTGAAFTIGAGDVFYTSQRRSSFQLQTVDPATGNVTNVGSPVLVSNVSSLEWDFTTPPAAPDEADLSLTKIVDDSSPTAGTDVIFTIEVTNGGPDDATDVEVRDLLPSGFAYVSDDAGGDYDDATGIWDVGTVTNGNSATLEITATVLQNGLHTNTAEVVSSTTFDPDSTPGSGEGDTFASARSFESGSDSLYAADGVGEFCGGMPSSLYELDGDTGDARKIAPITIGGQQVLNVVGLAVHPSTGELFGFLNFQEPADCNPVVEDGTLVTINPTSGDATVIGSMGAAGINASDIAFDPFGTLYAWSTSAAGSETVDLYTLDTTAGTSTLVGECGCVDNERNGLAVDPSGRMYLSDGFNGLYRLNQFTGAVFDPITVDLGAMNPMDFGPNGTLYTGIREDGFNDYVFELFATDADTGAQTQLGTVPIMLMSALAWDIGPITPPTVVPLSIDKSVNNAAPDDFEDVIFTIVVTNGGGADATGVKVTDVLPSGLTYVTDNSGGDYDPNTGIWDVLTVPDGGSRTLLITAHVEPFAGTRTNTAEVTAADTYDPNSVYGSGEGDTFDSQDVTPTATPGVDLATVVDVSGRSRQTNTKKGFTVKIRNVGTLDAAVSSSDLEVTINGNTTGVTCKPLSAVVRPGRAARVACSADLTTLGPSFPANVTYAATVDVAADGVPGNDSDSETRPLLG